MPMKCFSIAVGILCMIMSVKAYAQIDNLTNMSAEWIRMANRNAATDAADIVVYNPAGLTSLSDGLHLNVSNQFMFRKPKHSFTDPISGEGVSFEQDGPDLFIPNLYASYKKGPWSVFTGVYIPGAGVTIDYPDGSYTTRAIGADLLSNPESPFFGAYSATSDETIEVSSRYLTGTLGGAYKLSDQVSIAAGLRYIKADNKIEGNLTVTGGLAGPLTPDVPMVADLEQSAGGWGGVFGIQIVPMDKLNIAFHVETEVHLNFESDVSESDNLGLFADGERGRRDFPGMIGLGASYEFTDRLRGEMDLNYFFQEHADWGNSVTGESISGMAGDVWSIGAAAAYQAMPKLEVSCGFLYTKHAWHDMDGYYRSATGSIETLYSDNLNIATGIGYAVTDNLIANLSYSHTFWEDETLDTPIGEVDTENSTNIVAVGIDFTY